MAAVIRLLAPHEGELLRRVRLRALADSPESFATLLAEEVSLPESEWRTRAAAPDQVVFIAVTDEGGPVGMAGGRWYGEGREAVGVWGMWVAPEHRGKRLGARLVDAVAQWATSAGAARLRLGVMADVPASVGFYERLGFTRSREDLVLQRDPSRRWIEMSRAL